MNKIRKRVRVGDYVQYDNGEVVCDEDGTPLRVIEIKNHYNRECVIYNTGQFDFLADVEKADPLLVELL